MNALPILGEFLGTFLLMMSILATGNAIIIGLTLIFIIFLLGGISGAHVNPAVSLVILLKGAITFTEFFVYTIAQCAGAVAAYYTYNVLA